MSALDLLTDWASTLDDGEVYREVQIRRYPGREEKPNFPAEPAHTVVRVYAAPAGGAGRYVAHGHGVDAAAAACVAVDLLGLADSARLPPVASDDFGQQRRDTPEDDAQGVDG